MKSLGVIPARYHATRFDKKVLADICGKPMLQHIWERAKSARALDDLIVATDDEAVLKAVRAFGGRAVMTSKSHTTGTDRIAEAVGDLDVEIVVNIQGDEPLLEPSMLDDLVSCMLADRTLAMATLKCKIKDDKDALDPNIVKVVTDKDGFALYFSRAIIPYPRKKDPRVFYKHLGFYAYRKDFLFTFRSLVPTLAEQMESLEQLRALENGYRIKVIETQYDTISVDTPEDLKRVEGLMTNVKAQMTK